MEVQGNYPKFHQKLAEKEHFVSSKVSEGQPLFQKLHPRAARLQKLTTRALSKEIRFWKQKISQKAVVCGKVFAENSTKRFFAPPAGYMDNEKMLKVIGKHKLEANFFR